MQWFNTAQYTQVSIGITMFIRRSLNSLRQTFLSFKNSLQKGFLKNTQSSFLDVGSILFCSLSTWSHTRSGLCWGKCMTEFSLCFTDTCRHLACHSPPLRPLSDEASVDGSIEKPDAFLRLCRAFAEFFPNFLSWETHWKQFP